MSMGVRFKVDVYKFFLFYTHEHVHEERHIWSHCNFTQFVAISNMYTQIGRQAVKLGSPEIPVSHREFRSSSVKENPGNQGGSSRPPMS